MDHCIHGGRAQRAEIFDLVGRIPLNAHGVGLSIGTDVPLDLAYLDQVAEIVERLGAPTYSEHLAFTRVPGRDLANLLPLPKTEAVAEIDRRKGADRPGRASRFRFCWKTSPTCSSGRIRISRTPSFSI